MNTSKVLGPIVLGAAVALGGCSTTPQQENTRAEAQRIMNDDENPCLKTNSGCLAEVSKPGELTPLPENTSRTRHVSFKKVGLNPDAEKAIEEEAAKLREIREKAIYPSQKRALDEKIEECDNGEMLSCVEEKQLKRRIDTENSNLQVSQKQVGFKMGNNDSNIQVGAGGSSKGPYANISGVATLTDYMAVAGEINSAKDRLKAAASVGFELLDGKLQVVLTFAHDETKEKIRFSTEEFDEKIKTNSGALTFRINPENKYFKYFEGLLFLSKTEEKNYGDIIITVPTGQNSYEIWRNERELLGGKRTLVEGTTGVSLSKELTLDITVGYEKISGLDTQNKKGVTGGIGLNYENEDKSLKAGININKRHSGDETRVYVASNDTFLNKEFETDIYFGVEGRYRGKGHGTKEDGYVGFFVNKSFGGPKNDSKKSLPEFTKKSNSKVSDLTTPVYELKEKKTLEKVIDLNNLIALIAQAKKKPEAGYRPETWAPFSVALLNAENYIQNTPTEVKTKAETDAYYNGLKDAMDNLIAYELPKFAQKTDNITCEIGKCPPSKEYVLTNPDKVDINSLKYSVVGIPGLNVTLDKDTGKFTVYNFNKLDKLTNGIATLVVNIGNAFVTIDITIKVTDILVLPPEAPKIENQTCNAGGSVALFTPVPGVGYSIIGAPAGALGLSAGNLMCNFEGDFNFKVRATKDGKSADSNLVSAKVNPAPVVPPSISDIPNQVAEVGTSFSKDFSSYLKNAKTPKLSCSPDLPTGLTISGLKISGTPTTSGTVTCSVSDNGVSKSFEMKVNATTPTYEAPTFTGSVTGSKSITEGDTLSVIAPVNSPSGAYTCTQKGTNSPKLSSLVVSSVSGGCKVEGIINIVGSYSYQIEACLNAEPTKCTSYIVDGIEVNAVVTPPFIPSMPNINDVTVTPNFAGLIIGSIEKTGTTINVTAENDHTTNLVLSISLPSNYSFNSSSEQANTSVTSPRNYGLTPDMQTILVYQKNPSTGDYESVGNITVNIQWQ